MIDKSNKRLKTKERVRRYRERESLIKTKPTVIEFPTKPQYRMWELRSITVDSKQKIEAKIYCVYCNAFMPTNAIIDKVDCTESCSNSLLLWDKEKTRIVEKSITTENTYLHKDREYVDEFQLFPNYN